MKTLIIKNLAQISDNYDAIFCDVWGVIHNGRAQYSPAVLALQEYRKSGRPVVLISNSPKPSQFIPAQLAALDIGPETYDAIVTSGDATIEATKKFGRKAFRLGPPKDDGFFSMLDVDFVDAADAHYIICTGPRDDLTETAEMYRDELSQLVKHNIPFICANPDRIVQFGGRLIPCGGALADVYEELGGEVIMAGKPYQPIYDLTFAAANKILGKALDNARVLCIGDGIQTDVLGAQNMGLDCLFVTGGIHGAELSGANGLDEEKTEVFLKNHGLTAKYVMAEME